MGYISYSQINPLADFAFIAGTEYELEYMVYQSDGITPLDIGAATCKLLISPYGQPTVVTLEKAGVISGTEDGVFSVTLAYDDTKDMSGKYIQQPVIIDFYDKEYRLGQGTFTVIPRIAAS